MKIKMKLKTYYIFSVLFLSMAVHAQQLTVNEIFNEGAVLQQNSKVKVWGTSPASKGITISFQNKNVKTTGNPDGTWTADLQSLKAGGPFIMKIFCEKDTIRFNEIYVGEVWLAGGQSNMAFMLENSDNGKTEIANAKNNNIRFVMVPYKAFEGDKIRGDLNWRTATTENVSKMSAVAYYFAKDLQAKLKVPVGIICCYKGGSGAETWTTRESLMKNPELAPIVEKYENYFSELGNEKYMQLVAKYEFDLKTYQDSVKAGNKNLKSPKEPMGERNYNRPYGLYNTMLKRVIPYTVKGAIWYQGEHNSSRGKQYQTLFPAMIEQWRTDFRNPDMPFLFVQLPGYANADANNRQIWPELREAQLFTMQKVPNTGMAVINDLGNPTNIHPTHKEPVGKRLALIALNKTYQFNVPYSGPVFKSAQFKSGKAVITFDYIEKGLKCDGELQGFTICGEDKNFVPAKAQIINNQVVVSAEGVGSPVAVRYDWSNWTIGNLKNSADLQASPFRTDNFPLLSESNKTDKY